MCVVGHWEGEGERERGGKEKEGERRGGKEKEGEEEGVLHNSNVHCVDLTVHAHVWTMYLQIMNTHTLVHVHVHVYTQCICTGIRAHVRVLFLLFH